MIWWFLGELWPFAVRLVRIDASAAVVPIDCRVFVSTPLFDVDD